MSIEEEVRAAIKEFFLLPEWQELKREFADSKTLARNIENSRLDDMFRHMMDQSRRIEVLNSRISNCWDHFSERITEIIIRLDRLHVAIVRQEEHLQLTTRVERLEQRMVELQKRLTASG